jgi:HEAT repeat protein
MMFSFCHKEAAIVCVSKKILCVNVLLLTLCACDGSSGAMAATSWIEQIKHRAQPMIAWFDSLSVVEPVGQKANVEKKSDKVNEADVQAQAQIVGMMENMSTPPTGELMDEPTTAEDLLQYHRDYDTAPTVEDKCDALDALVKADPDNTVTILRDAYADSETELRKAAVLQMQAFNNQAAVVDLLLKALGDPDSSVVIEAVEGLARLHDPRVIVGLKKVAATHPDEVIRTVAEDYVGQSGQNAK